MDDRRETPSKPAALRVLQGSRGARPLPKNEAKPRPLIPRPPAHLDATAKRQWRRIAKALTADGLLTELDRTALAMLCLAYSRLVDAEKNIQKHGVFIRASNGDVVESPYVSISFEAMDQIRVLAIEFGMTPASRARIRSQLPTPGPHDESS